MRLLRASLAVLREDPRLLVFPATAMALSLLIGVLCFGVSFSGSGSGSTRGSFFLASLPRIGAARASLLSTVEPVVTLVLAAALLGDRLSPIQLAGGALVLFAVITVQGLHLRRPGPPSAIR